MWNLPSPGVASGGKSHPERGTFLTQAGEDHILEVIDRVFVVLNLSCGQSHSDVNVV